MSSPSNPTSAEAVLGRREDQWLEFKAAEALGDLSRIAREVVAMLNAEGGEVWIGIVDEGGRAVKAEPIHDVETEHARLLDRLVDTIDPPLSHTDLQIESPPAEAANPNSGEVLRVVAKPENSRRPYSYLHRGGRHFPKRIGARLRPMSRSEIARAFSSDAWTPDDHVAAKEDFLSVREKWIGGDTKGLYLFARAIPDLSIDLASDRVLDIVTDPQVSGNRRTGKTFVTPDAPVFDVDGNLICKSGLGAEVRVEITRAGYAEFFAGRGTLLDHQGYLEPLALAEYPVSAFRILGRIYEFCRQGEAAPFRVLSDLVLLTGPTDGLPPQTPFGQRLRLPEPLLPRGGPDVVLDRPLDFKSDEIIKNPDRCAFRLLRPIFAAFGLDESEMPQEFDRRSGRLVLRE